MICYKTMNPSFRWVARLAIPLLLAPAAAAAQQPQDCFDSIHVDPEVPTAIDPVAVTIEGLVNYCSGVRIAAIGERGVLGPPFEHELNIVVAMRDPVLPPGVSCPAAEVPYTLVAHLPQTLAQNNPHDGPHRVGLYLRLEDPAGNVRLLKPCGEIGVYVESGFRDAELLHDGRFRVTVEWKVGSGNRLGYVVPSAHEPPADAALFWFFAPENWELMVKVLDGCALNGHWWVLGAAATDVEFRLQIVDTMTGAAWEHRNPRGILAPAFADVEAFDGCPGSGGS